MFSLRRALLPAVLLLAAGTTDALASRTRVGGCVRIYRYGFSMRIPSRWQRLPPRPSETAVVRRWYGNAKTGVPPTLRVLRIERKPKKPGGEPGGEPGGDASPAAARSPQKPAGPETVKDWLDDHLAAAKGQGRIEEARDMKVGRDRARLFLATIRGASLARPVNRVMLVAVLRTEEAEYGIVFDCERDEFKKLHRAAFFTCIASFRPLEVKKEADVDYEAAFEAEKPLSREEKEEARWLAMIKDKTRDSRTWSHFATQNYLVLFDTQVPQRKVMRIAVHVEAIRRDVFEPLLPADEPITAISLVRVCKDREQYTAYGGIPGSAGYWSDKEQELVFWDQSADSIRTLYHEAFHQYIYHALGRVAPHVWFNEGHAEYFAGFEFRGRFRPGPNVACASVIGSILASEQDYPIDEFLVMPPGEFYADARVCYPQAWAFVYFLRRSCLYPDLLPLYFETLKKEVAALRKKGPFGEEERRKALERALEAALEGIHPDLLDSSWRTYGY